MWRNKKKLIALLLALFLMIYLGISKLAFAEDDDDDDDDRYEQSDDREDDEMSAEKLVDQIIQLPDKYITKTIIENIIKKDSDRDGLLDENDPHPEIAEIYIVSDENKNGIDDKYDLDFNAN